MYNATNAEELVKRLKNNDTDNAEIIRQLAELCLNWPYVWASNGEMCTPSWRRNRIPYCKEQKYIDMIRNNCPVLSGSSGSCVSCKWNNCRCFDCQGFVHWLLTQIEVPLYGGGATTQWNTNSNWAVKGDISKMPLNLPCCIYKRKDNTMSHAGMSMGDRKGSLIHCSTYVKRGNIATDIPKWTHFGIPAGMYPTYILKQAGFNVTDADNTPVIRKGNTGRLVEILQNSLINHGIHVSKVDKIFGKETEEAVKAFQKQKCLSTDGIVGYNTWKALNVALDELIGSNQFSANNIPISSDNIYIIDKKIIQKLHDTVKESIDALNFFIN